ncbi:MAG: hypothetical protein ACK2TT_00985 [Anaerolineales bacterium]
MISRDFAAAIEECLQRLDRGENLPDVLANFPHMAEKLEPLLLVAMASRAFPVPVPGQTAQRLGRNQMLAVMAEMKDRGALRKKPSVPLTSRLVGQLAGALRNFGYNKVAYSYRLAMVSLVLILSGGFLTLNASASSQPGDLLYTLKQGMERTGLVWMIGSDEESEDLVLPGMSAVRSERAIEVLTGVNVMLTGEDESAPPPAFANANLDGASNADLKAEEKELAAAEREAKKTAAAEAREQEQELKEAEKIAAAEAREEEQELKEEEKAAAAAEREAEQELKQAEKDAAKQAADQSSNSSKKNSNITKPAPNNNSGKGKNK